MYDHYRQKREEILLKMEKEKNPNRKATEEEEIKLPEAVSYYKISDDTDIQKYSVKIITNLNKVCNEVTDDIFQCLYNCLIRNLSLNSCIGCIIEAE